MSRLVLISNKQCDSKDLACATQALSSVDASDDEQGLWLGWNGDVQNFGAAPLLRQIPEHQGLIESLFFYDLIGFQSLDDRNNFLNYLANEYPVEVLPDDQLQVNGHIFATGIFPAGINARNIY